LHTADLVIVMTAHQQRQLRWLLGRPDALHLGDLDPGPTLQRDVEDPIDKEPEIFEQVFSRIDRAVQALVDLIVQAEAADFGAGREA
jgi:protein-tyrosine-phosphatase